MEMKAAAGCILKAKVMCPVCSELQRVARSCPWPQVHHAGTQARAVYNVVAGAQGCRQDTTLEALGHLGSQLTPDHLN